MNFLEECGMLQGLQGFFRETQVGQADLLRCTSPVKRAVSGAHTADAAWSWSASSRCLQAMHTANDTGLYEQVDC